MRARTFWMAALLIAAACASASADFGRFEAAATYRGLGGLVASVVGPGPSPGSQRFYLSYLYLDNTIDLVAVDPDTGAFEVFPNPVPSEFGARTMVVGPDGKIYLGTLPGAHILCLDPGTGAFTDLGRPSQTEQYIWDLAVAGDGRLYGATYPQAKLVRYDPESGVLEDLGRMDPTEQYAHYVAGSEDGFVYVGIGTSKANIAVYEIATGEHREILPPQNQVVAQAIVYRGQDRRVYGRVGAQYFRLEGWNAVPIAAGEASPQEPKNRLSDGRIVGVEKNIIRVTDPQTQTTAEHPFDYAGDELAIFRLGIGPDGGLYASSVLPIHFLRLSPGRSSVQELGDLGGGEVYSFLSHGDWLLMAAYSGEAPLMTFDPRKPFQQGSSAQNPALVNYRGQDSGWRPEAMINGPDGSVYLGAVAGYGQLGGPLTIWNVDAETVTSYPQLVTDQSVVSLTAANGLIVGGTTIAGGGGSHPTQKEAKLFVWDPAAQQKIFETVPVPGAATITDLVTAPNGLVYGIGGSTLFAFDAGSLELKFTAPLPFSSAIYNSAAVGPDGRIWGLAAAGIFVIDPNTNEAALVAQAPRPVTAGFAMCRNAIYYASKASLYRYQLPVADLSGGPCPVTLPHPPRQRR